MTETTTPIGDAIKDIGKNGEGFDLDVTKDTDGKTALGAEGFKDIGEPGGWALGGRYEWIKGVGQRVMGKLQWRPRERK